MKCYSRPERIITLSKLRSEPTRLLEMVIADINSLVVRFDHVVFGAIAEYPAQAFTCGGVLGISRFIGRVSAVDFTAFDGLPSVYSRLHGFS